MNIIERRGKRENNEIGTSPKDSRQSGIYTLKIKNNENIIYKKVSLVR